MRAPARTALLTSLALVAFAANSVLCRMALGGGAIGAAGFSAVRLVSGALALLAIARVTRVTGRGRAVAVGRGSWGSAAMLFLYAVAFSYAYLELSAGTGALVLFGSVQATMIGVALVTGERPRAQEWIGLALALVGLVVLVLPGLTAPSPLGTGLMAVAGVAWGAYTLRGRGSGDPLADTTGNFARSVPLVLTVGLVAAFAPGDERVTGGGVLLAVLSGALASGVGYVIWYAALRGLSATRAATVQLSVPVIAAMGGVALLDERVTPRLALAALLILGGVGLAVASRAAPQASSRAS